ncbi:SDR family NAD(P)-dependent oxidoreductase [Burkholderia sp. Bp8963]|nr:glucose 1-dehydrogenase [Burkholderia sp. Bp8963]RQS67011.1 SDR family NAD(P)-dependent oxidoreductase [Burkholderia sp. Bp8963]
MRLDIDALFSLCGRRPFVTGASSGLGRYFARALAQAGATVVVAARRVDRLNNVVAEIEQAGGMAIAASIDVTSADSVRLAFDAIQADVGVVDLVINNAGVASTHPLLEHSEQTWDEAIDTNLKGAYLVATEAARRMVAAGVGGAVINIASITGLRVAGGVAPYCASKAGLIHLTRSMALELARHRIRVNAIAPGYVSTELNAGFLASDAGQKLMSRIPGRAFGRPEDLLGPLLLLASDAGAYMTGSVVAVDGGHLVSSL